MKRINAFLIIALFLSSTTFLKAQEIMISTDPLEVIGDSIRFTVELDMPAKAKYGNSGTLQVNPRLGDYKYDYFPSVPVRITNAASNGIRQSIDVALPFIEDMDANGLDVDVIYTSDDGKERKSEYDDIVECCNTLGMLFANNSQFQFATRELVKEGGKQPKKLMAQFNFPLDISELDPDEYEKDIRQMGDFLRKYPNSTVTVRGFASPEGPYDRNVYLSENRSNRASEWLQVQLKKYGYNKVADAARFEVDVTHEDWIGFLQMVKESDEFSGHFEEIREIVSSGMSPQETELAVLEELGYTWEERHAEELEELWKPLRRSVVVLETENATEPILSEEEVDEIVQAYIAGELPQWQLREILTQEQWLEAAQETYAEDGEMSLLIAYYGVFPDDYRIINDLAILDLVDNADVMEGNGLAIIGGDDALVGLVPGGYDVKWKKDIEKGSFKYKYKVKQEDGPENEIDFVYEIEDFDGTIPMLELAYEMDREDWAVLSNLGGAYLNIGNYYKAQHYLERSLERKNTPEANYNLALTYANRAMLDEAIRYFDKVEKENIKGFYYNRGLAKLLNDDYRGAQRDLERHISDNPEHAVAHYVLAALGAEIQDEDMMAKHLRHAISIKNILSDVSQEDLAFRNYWETEVFEDASDDDPKLAD